MLAYCFLLRNSYTIRMTVRMRHTHAHTANRRSHHALKDGAISPCTHCQAMKLRHTVCATCGFYRGKKIIDTVKKIEKKQKRVAAKVQK